MRPRVNARAISIRIARPTNFMGFLTRQASDTRAFYFSGYTRPSSFS
jgi:hypothetical protein